MKEILRKIKIPLLVVFFLLPVVTFAQEIKYKLLEPLTPDMPSDGVTLESYLPFVFNLLIGLAAAMAVIVIVIGGFKYMTSDAIQGKNSGRDMIKNAIFGLILVLGAWLILYTINRDLLSVNLSLKPVDFKSDSGVSMSNCSNCQIVEGVPFKPGVGVNLDSSLVNSAQNLSKALKVANIDWRVTEGFPPTVSHQSACHNNGTCFDANFYGETPATPENIKTFIEAAKNSGLSPYYEVNTQEKKQALIKDGVPGENIWITNNPGHFHLQK